MARSTAFEEEIETVRKPVNSITIQKARSYKVAIKTRDNKEEWAYNGLRFPSQTSAERYGHDLDKRWSLMIAYEVQQSDEPSNANYPVPSDRYDVQR